MLTSSRLQGIVGKFDIRLLLSFSFRVYLCEAAFTDPCEDLLLLLGFVVDAQRAVFLGAGFLHAGCPHVPPPAAEELDGLSQRRAFVPAVLLSGQTQAGFSHIPSLPTIRYLQKFKS